MNIALVAVEVHKHGGVPLCVAELLEHLRQNHNVAVFSNQLMDVDMEGIQHYHIPVPQQPRFLRPIVFTSYFNALFTFLRLFRGAQFDIVHSAGEEGGFPANVITSHFCQRSELEALANGTVKLPTATWEQKLRALDYMANRYIAAGMEWFYFGRDNHRLRTAVSHRMKADFVRYYGKPAEAIVAIPNGVNIDEFHPRLKAQYRHKIRREVGLKDDDFVLFFIGGDWERKGVPQAIETLTYVPDRRVKLLVVGMGDSAHYRGMADRLGVGDRVTFITKFVRQAQYYAASDVFLFPTQYEPFGLVILEAMATGIPVVTSAVAGASDYLEDGVDAFLVEDVRSARELGERVNLLATDRNLYNRMCQQARDKAEKMSWGEITHTYEAAYRSYLQGIEVRVPQMNTRVA